MIYIIAALILIIVIMSIIMYFKSNNKNIVKLGEIKKDIKLKEEELIIAKAERNNVQQEINILNKNIEKVIEEIKDNEILTTKLDNIKSSYRPN